jgi:hypothetical protein
MAISDEWILCGPVFSVIKYEICTEINAHIFNEEHACKSTDYLAYIDVDTEGS